MEKHIRLYILWFPEIANQMEEPKEMSNNKNAEQLDVYNVAYSPKQQVKKDIAEKLYQVLSFSESILIQEIDKCKIDVGTDKKRCHNRLNKGRMDLEYSKQVHAELLLPKKPIDGGAQELNCVIGENLVHRIQHGNNKRAEEAKLYHEIKNLNDSIEIYTEPTAVNETWRRNWPWRPALPKGYKHQHLEAYDSVRWDFLGDVLNRFGFGAKWCGWIQECLRSSRGSVLVNGSTTEEFQFYKGLKQGDPLSPFLFILVMESLHLSFKRVEDAGMFNGIKINSSMTLSHMFYADDAIFMGQWSKRNIDTLMYMLKCFERASGLSINLSKSKLMGLAVSIEKVEEVTRHIGCGILNTPFSFLGSKVGGCMSRIKSWDEVIDKMVNRLSKWKMKTLSIGGRLTLLKAVFGSMPIYHMSIFKVPMLVLQRMESIRCHFFNGNDLDSKRSIWVSWNKVLTSKEKGGLGVSSLFALNRVLMFKWVWRFFNQSDSLWVRVIHAIHGVDGRISRAGNVRYTPIWCDIIKEMDRLASHGIDLISMMHKKRGNGSNTSFWKDRWRGEHRLKEVFPRIYALEVNKHISVAFKFEQTSLASSLRRMPRSGTESEQWDHLLDSLEGVMLSPSKDRWSWDLNGSREFSVASARRAIFRRIYIWWDVSYMELDSFDEWISWITNLRLPSKHKRLLEGKQMAAINLPRKIFSKSYATTHMIRLYSKIHNEPTSSPNTEAEKCLDYVVERKKEAIRFKHMNFEKALEMKNLRMKEAKQFKQMNFENALERKKELIRFKHMNYENALELKNLRMKEAIQFKHMNFENALERKNLLMIGRSRSLKYQGSSDKENDFNPPSRQTFVTTLGDYLKGARSLVEAIRVVIFPYQ
ncbi:RNA-directed DNA polymerase, eukaryota, reverse transcriptase zinc-binding domain protein [Tanacetum coccineum]